MDKALPLLLVAILSCSSSEEASNATPSPMVKELSEFADKACACKDATCTAGVNDEVAAFAKGITGVTDSDRPLMQAAQARLDRCVVALDPLVDSYEKLVAEICACVDKACAERSSKSFTSWSAKLKTSKAKLSPAVVTAITTAGRKGGACFEKHDVSIPR